MGMCVCVCVCMCVHAFVNIKEHTYLTREVWPDDVFSIDDIEQRDVLKKIFLDAVSSNYVSVCVNVCLHLCVVLHALMNLSSYRTDVCWYR